jgi:hypothetical protein
VQHWITRGKHLLGRNVRTSTLLVPRRLTAKEQKIIRIPRWTRTQNSLLYCHLQKSWFISAVSRHGGASRSEALSRTEVCRAHGGASRTEALFHARRRIVSLCRFLCCHMAVAIPEQLLHGLKYNLHLGMWCLDRRSEVLRYTSGMPSIRDPWFQCGMNG